MNSTLDYYNRSADKYIEDSLHADVSDLYAHFLPKVPKGGSILDLGCGSGRDSKHFMELGYLVTAVDGSEEFCKRAINEYDATVHTSVANTNSGLRNNIIDTDIPSQAKSFFRRHEDSIELLPLCQIANIVNPTHNHVNKMYDE